MKKLPKKRLVLEYPSELYFDSDIEETIKRIYEKYQTGSGMGLDIHGGTRDVSWVGTENTVKKIRQKILKDLKKYKIKASNMSITNEGN